MSTTNQKDVLGRLTERLSATRKAFGIGQLLSGGSRPDEETVEDIEAMLLGADVGIDATQEFINALEQPQRGQTPVDAMRQSMIKVLEPCTAGIPLDRSHRPFVIMAVGVNGVGKTTTCGKLAQHFREQGLSVMLAAADTFRAAAVEQLQQWGDRLGVPVIAQHTGADAAAVAHDAMSSAQAKAVDVLIIDTAGRLHTQDNLMDELAKIRRVVQKIDDSAPHEVLLVVDGGTGQNAVSQLKHFASTVSVSGIAVTKLDGTSKGGVVFAMVREQGIPVRYIGVGERAEDLREFDAEDFVDALLPKADT